MSTLRLIKLDGIPRHQKNGQRAHALRSQDKHALDICRRRGTRMEDGVTTLPKLGSGIGTVDVDDDIRRIQQNDQINVFPQRYHQLRSRVKKTGVTASRSRSGLMDVIGTDIAIVGAGGASLCAAIAVAEADSSLTLALISKVYPMRSHTVAAEGGAASGDQGQRPVWTAISTTPVSGGDWLCDQDAVKLFVDTTLELLQLEH
jgi:hypothetical protein